MRLFLIGVQWEEEAAVLRQHPPQPNRNWGRDLALCRERNPTLRHVPKAARMTVAETLTRQLEATTSSDDGGNWGGLFAFGYCVLGVPPKEDKIRIRNMAKYVKSQVSEWDQNPSRTLPTARPPRPPSNGKKDTDKAKAKRIEAKLADADVSGAIRLLMSDDTIAPLTEETITALKVKHPRHPVPTDYPEPPPILIIPQVTDDEVRSAIGAFP